MVIHLLEDYLQGRSSNMGEAKQSAHLLEVADFEELYMILQEYIESGYLIVQVLHEHKHDDFKGDYVQVLLITMHV